MVSVLCCVGVSEKTNMIKLQRRSKKVDQGNQLSVKHLPKHRLIPANSYTIVAVL